MASKVYKIVDDIAPDYIKDLINIKQSNNFRRENQASLPAVKSTRHGLRSFHYEAARIWNSFPNDLRLAESSLSSRDCSMHGMVTFVDVLHVKFGLCFALLLQFSFNSLALPLLTSFCFSTPSFFAFFRFRFVAKAVILRVSIYCNLNVKFFCISSKMSQL